MGHHHLEGYGHGDCPQCGAFGSAGFHKHAMGQCPTCGGVHREGHGKKNFFKFMTKKAYKKILFEKIKDEVNNRYGSKLEEAAKEIVNMSSEKMKMKGEFYKKNKEMKQKLIETFSEMFEDAS